MCPSQIRDYPGLANPKVPKIFPKSSQNQKKQKKTKKNLPKVFPKSSQNQKKTMPSKAPGWKGADVRERSNILVLAFNWPILFKTWNQLKIYGKPWIFPWNVGMFCKCSIDGKMLALVWTSISPINLGNDRLSRVFNLFNHRFFGDYSTSKTCSNRKGRIFGVVPGFSGVSLRKTMGICNHPACRSERGNRCSGLMPARRCHPRWRSPHSIQCWSWRAAPVTLFWDGLRILQGIMEATPNHPKVDCFSIESHGDLGIFEISHFKKPSECRNPTTEWCIFFM